MQRSVRENIALPFSTPVPELGPDRRRRRARATSTGAIETLQIDTRAASEVRRLSGGNQQKVTIARWVAGGVRTMLCFDPTRGIDIGTKRRSTSSSATWPPRARPCCCTRRSSRRSSSPAIGRSSSSAAASWPRSRSPRPTSRPCCGPPTTCRRTRRCPRRSPRPSGRRERGRVGDQRALTPPRRCSRSTGRAARRRAGRRGAGSRPMDDVAAWARRNSWTLALLGLLVVFLAITQGSSSRATAPRELQGLAIAVLPIAFAAVAQAIVVISGGIDLSVGSMMALASVDRGRPDEGPERPDRARRRDRRSSCSGSVLGLVNGGLIVVTRVPDIVVTLAMSFVWAGVALLVLHTPGGGAAPWLMALSAARSSVNGSRGPSSSSSSSSPSSGSRSAARPSGSSLYAIGSNRLAAFRSGVSVGRTKVLAYALTGLFSAMGGLALTASTGIGSPVPGRTRSRASPRSCSAA